MWCVSGQGCPAYRENIKMPIVICKCLSTKFQAHLSPVVRVRLHPIGLGSIETGRSLLLGGVKTGRSFLLHTPAVKAEVVGNF